ncbi:hypothetical protein [Psychromonas sp. Urea-02u-13]|uniref:hypothetical protein n=1 Tax=Psychromonas sp. Urea-02u-13 TaxID=2058326 RepID=UPI000C31D7CF|nr:hypothetical protein [Psychromonas sp. Urea-02u-13]PKG37209.1 hypothetical protein CXF74_20090 [Psychromonas sp. Urea-02u-13]
MHYLKYVIILTFIFSGMVHSQTNLQFLSKIKASENLVISDEFIVRLSQFDMAARMKTDQVVDKKQFLEFVSSSVIDWNKSDITKVTKAFDSIRSQLQKLKIDLPSKIGVILTDGKEEGNAPYTRGNSIILQHDKLSSSKELKKLIAHEIFHIYSRNNPLVKDNLYKAIGFFPAKELEFPNTLKGRRITNPDAPNNNYVIRVKFNNEKLWVYPIIFSETDRYIPSKRGEFYDYLQFKLLVLDDGSSRILDFSQVSGYFEQVGKNTNYIIHPEEILADNFALMVLGITAIPSPEIIDKMKNVFRQSSLINVPRRTPEFL